MRLLALLLVPALVGHPDPGVLWSFSDERISESSGLVDLGDVMVTANDSGNDPIAFVLDARTGREVGETWLRHRMLDMEAIAPAGGHAVWLGDIGDNLESRRSISVYRVPVGRSKRVVAGERFDFAYPDGPHNAEAMVVSGGRFYFITKAAGGGAVYRSEVPGRGLNRLTRIGSVSEYATDAALFGSGRRIIVRSYTGAGVYSFPAFDRLADVALPPQPQGEGISVGPADRVRVSSEGVGSPVLAVAVPPESGPVGLLAGILAGS